MVAAEAAAAAAGEEQMEAEGGQGVENKAPESSSFFARSVANRRILKESGVRTLVEEPPTG